MTTVMEILEAVGAFLVGLVARLGVTLVLGLVLLVPAVIIGVSIHLVRRHRAAAVPRVDGIELRHGAWHAPNHTWLASCGPGELEVGLDDLGQRILPSVTAVELPRPGMSVHRGDPIAVLRAGQRIVRLGAPVDGTVLRVNGRVRWDPGLVKREPYGGGWLFRLEPADRGYLELPRDAAAEGWMRSERQRLERFVEQELGFAAADGGALVVPVPGALGEDGWKRLVSAFLHAA
ncbi:glycine cleavage system protein H [Anaeromyxobacter oryzisoli]|uniref:glycine cleavage system protein H n=1 Tax=Anaeromyxobacter oryzisoli TaxID=2925408 RepID=UPI001F58F96D|nr:glycine cleavage system protein H [Anaeromyxobacter sp. SG63]